MPTPKIAILNFGGEGNICFVERFRASGGDAVFLNYDAPIELLQADDIIGIVITGSADHVYEAGARMRSDAFLKLGKPVLGICYGIQLIAYLCGAEVRRAPVAENGMIRLYHGEHPLFKDFREDFVPMAHEDQVFTVPQGFSNIAHTADCAICAIVNDEKRIYGLQFHPERDYYREEGLPIFKNFYDICIAARE